MQRLRSIDNFRAITMVMMIWIHLRLWWLRDADQWFVDITLPFTDRVFACAFLMIAGASATLFTRSRLIKVNKIGNYTLKIVKKEYYFRALLIFIIAIGYNSFVALIFMNPLIIWKWFLLMTTAVSLMLIWPLLKISKVYRIILAIILWIINYYLFLFLSYYQSDSYLFGFLNYFLYHSVDQDPILFTFSFFIIGSVLGDVMFDINLINNQGKRRNKLKYGILYPSVIIGLFLIIIGLIYEYPHYNNNHNFSWIAFPLGFNLILFAILTVLENFKVWRFKTNFRFLYYFSYYSLMVFIAHNIFYFLFYKLLDLINIWVFIPVTILLFGILLHFIFNSRWRQYLSIKLQLGKIAKGLVERKDKNDF
ncbi:MAG: heparan-alpha-glucosaminide N-acetyltransferase domain-containing protein [Promethearchaeota archaeon]